MGDGQTILFMPACEGVAHAGRMLLVAQALRERFSGKIEFAGNGKFGTMFPEAGFTFYEVEGGFSLKRLAFVSHQRWSVSELRAFFKEVYDSLLTVIDHEVKLYRTLKPDVVVWDGRFTVLTSAEVFGVPSISVMHAYATPYTTLKPGIPRTLPLFHRYPGLLLLTRLPQHTQRSLTDLFRKAIHALLLKGINRIRSIYKLEPIHGGDDFYRRLPMVILPDLEILAPTANLPANFHYVGPLAWQPQMEIPEAIKEQRDVIYVSMGLTGNPHLFKPLIDALAQMPELRVVISTGNLIDPATLDPLPKNAQVYRFLPGIEMAKRARLVICHGAPGTTAQALSQGVPIIGIPYIIPHEFGIDRIAALGAGIKLDPTALTSEKITHAVRECLHNKRYRSAAARIAEQFTLQDGPDRAADLILTQVSRVRTKQENA